MKYDEDVLQEVGRHLAKGNTVMAMTYARYVRNGRTDKEYKELLSVRSMQFMVIGATWEFVIVRLSEDKMLDLRWSEVKCLKVFQAHSSTLVAKWGKRG